MRVIFNGRLFVRSQETMLCLSTHEPLGLIDYFPSISISASVIGSIVSSTILEPTVVNGTEVEPTEEILQFCGANDCPDNNITNPNLEEPDSALVVHKFRNNLSFSIDSTLV